MASADATRQAVWLRLLLKDFGHGLDGPLSIFNDNNAAILLSKNPVNHDRSKHIDIRHHFLRDKVSDNTVELSHVPTEDNLASSPNRWVQRCSLAFERGWVLDLLQSHGLLH